MSPPRPAPQESGPPRSSATTGVLVLIVVACAVVNFNRKTRHRDRAPPPRAYQLPYGAGLTPPQGGVAAQGRPVVVAAGVAAAQPPQHASAVEMPGAEITVAVPVTGRRV